MIRITSKGDFKITKNFLHRLQKGDIYADLHKYGEMGVRVLESATPKDTGLTASRWRYKLIGSKQNPGIEWYNTNITSQGVPIVVLIQYGHGTRDGGYVQGKDFINPAIRPIFDKIAQDIWKKVQA